LRVIVITVIPRHPDKPHTDEACDVRFLLVIYRTLTHKASSGKSGALGPASRRAHCVKLRHAAFVCAPEILVDVAFKNGCKQGFGSAFKGLVGAAVTLA